MQITKVFSFQAPGCAGVDFAVVITGRTKTSPPVFYYDFSKMPILLEREFNSFILAIDAARAWAHKVLLQNPMCNEEPDSG